MSDTKTTYREALRWTVTEARRRGIKGVEAVRNLGWNEQGVDLDYWDVWRALRDGI